MLKLLPSIDCKKVGRAKFSPLLDRVFVFPALELYARFALTEAFFLFLPGAGGILARLKSQKQQSNKTSQIMKRVLQ